VPCWYHDTYDSSKSSSYKADGEKFEITYGSGSIKGTVSKDNIQFGDASTSNFGFGEVTSVSGVSFLASQMSGILGLGYGTISVDSLPTFVDVSDESDKSFSFVLHLNPEDSYMTMPGYDETLVSQSQFTFHNVVEEAYYSLTLNSVAQGSTKTDATGYKAVIDSGTSVIVGPNELVDPMIKGISVDKDCKNYETLPDLTWTIDNIDYTMKSTEYIIKLESGGQTSCTMGVMAMDFGSDFKYFILGDSFMRRYYSYFDKKNNRVGFVDTTKL